MRPLRSTDRGDGRTIEEKHTFCERYLYARASMSLKTLKMASDLASDLVVLENHSLLGLALLLLGAWFNTIPHIQTSGSINNTRFCEKKTEKTLHQRYLLKVVSDWAIQLQISYFNNDSTKTHKKFSSNT